MRVKNEQCFVLHTTPFSETSLIVQLFTRTYGRISVLAKGARRLKSQFRGHIRPFVLSNASWVGKGNVPTLIEFQNETTPNRFDDEVFYCNTYVNELISRLVADRDPHPALFDEYCAAMQSLAEKSVDPFVILRIFEKNLIRELGYELVLRTEDDRKTPIDANCHYIYNFNSGPSPADPTDPDAIMGKTLIAIEAGQFTSPNVKKESRKLLERALTHYLEGRTVSSREILWTNSA